MHLPRNDDPGGSSPNGAPDTRFQHLKAPPLTPELREWLQRQHTDEEIIAWVRELREKGGLDLSEFLPELEQIVGQP